MRLYAIDEADDALSLLPMAARRALDAAGLRVSLLKWQSIPVSRRRIIAELGTQAEVAVETVRFMLQEMPDVEQIEPRFEPSADEVPEVVQAAFRSEFAPISRAVWSALSPLDRYVLDKVAEKRRPDRLRAAYQEIIGESAHSSHLDPRGHVRMVNIGAKHPTHRVAMATSRVIMSAEAFVHLKANNPKGDVLATARLAGIMASKKTADWIPLCHPIAVTRVEVELAPDAEQRWVDVTATVEAFDRTGVEMEALVAATGAALTVYDMLKAFDRGMSIGPTRLLKKTGGRSGDYAAASLGDTPLPVPTQYGSFPPPAPDPAMSSNGEKTSSDEEKPDV